MNNFQDTYPIVDFEPDIDQETRNDYRFYFISKGKKDIYKAIQYEYLEELNNAPLFNLGFGDLDADAEDLLDQSVSGNDDHYKVFYTVLNTMPRLFLMHSDATILVQGSDSTPEFIAKCKANCTRGCDNEECKKAHRRIKIYRHFVDKNFDTLNSEYDFFGGVTLNKYQNAEPYQKGEKYISVLVKRKTPYYEN